MASHPEFGERTPGSKVAEVFGDQIRSKTVLITGISPRSIGLTTATAIASQAPSLLILASRTRTRVEEVAAEIKSKYPATRIEIVLLDLASQKAIRQAVSEINKLTSTLDILINNAGVMVTSRQKTSDGLELAFGTNHIGPFLFTNLLFPLLRNAARSNPPGATRVVNLTSKGHRLSPIRFSDYNFEGKPVPPDEDHVKPLPGTFNIFTDDGYNGIVTYCQSKTANILFTLYLQKVWQRFGIVAYAVQPGTIETDLSRNQSAELTSHFYKTALYWKTRDEGSSTTLVAALDPGLNVPKGHYLDDCQVAEPFPHANDPVAADRLWRLSEDLVGERFAFDD